MATVEQLYKLCEQLDNVKDDYEKHGALYDRVLSGVNGDAQAKKLTAQFIFRYFAKFPTKKAASTDALFSLCESDVPTRKLVVAGLPSLCADPGDHVARFADLLTQLLQSDDATEVTMVQNALMRLLKSNTKDTLTTVLQYVSSGENALLRTRALHFLTIKLADMAALLTPDLQTFVCDEAKKVLAKVAGDDFILLMSIVQKMPHYQTLQGRKELLAMVIAQANLDRPFNAKKAERVDQLLQCMKHSLPYLSKNVTSNEMLTFVITSVLPSLAKVVGVGGASAGDTQLALLRATAEIAAFTNKMDEAYIDSMVDACVAMLPAPVTDATADLEEACSDDVPFSQLECMLYVLQQMLKRNPDYNKGDAEPRLHRLAAFKKSMMYFGRVTQLYNKKLQTAMRGKSKIEQATDEYKVQVAALRTTDNLSKLVLQFMKRVYSDGLTLSWKPNIRHIRTAVSLPRGTDENGASEAKKRKPIMAPTPYKPPGGKYSDGVDQFADKPTRGRGRGRGGRW